MSVFVVVVDFERSPLVADAAAALDVLPDRHFEPLVTRACGAVVMAVKAHRLTPQSRYECQPLLRDGIHIVGDCRLDNRAELLRALHLDAAEAPSDIDLLYFAYQHWREGLVEHLRGDYSVVLHDSRTATLWAFVDHFATRKLFYRQQGSRLYLSNQLVRLRRGLPYATTLSRAWLSNFVMRAGHLMQCPRHLTAFEEISQLTWGQRLCVRANGTTFESYCDFGAATSVRASGDDRELIIEAQRLFRQAVARRLRTLQPVACHLSGGLDSSSTALMALELLPPSATLTCLHYEPAREISMAQSQTRVAHERERLAALEAQYPRLDVQRFSGASWPLERVLEVNLEYGDMPLANAVNHCWMTEMAEACANAGRQVILSGSMGNHTLSLDGSVHESSWGEDLRYWLRALAGPQSRQSRARRTLLSNAGRAQLSGRTAFRRQARRARILQTFMAAKGLDLEASLKNAFGVEHWMPVADYDFARFVWTLPPPLFRDRSGKKRLVREIMAERMPPRVLDQRLRGVQSPDAFAWYYDEIETLRDHFSSAQRHEGACWDGSRLVELIAQPRERQLAQEDMMSSVFSCYCVSRLREHIGQPSW